MNLDRHKEISPEQTVKRNKKILTNLGIFPKLTWQHSISGLWSVNFEDTDIEWFCNGKGSTKKFAEASGYGEALERLSNIMGVFDINNVSEDDLNYKNFRFFSDEVRKPINSLFIEAPIIWPDARMQGIIAEGRDVTVEEVTSFWAEVLNEKDSFSFIPFLDVKNKTEYFFPSEILAYLCGSNGMCEGNTPEEALVQGLSEIYERFVEPYIYNNNLTPPEVPLAFIQDNYPEHFSIIQEIEKKSNYKIHIFDCSLGKGFPVLGIMIIDTTLQRYYMQYGASPCFAIALERCLTELYQGVDFGDSADNTIHMTPYTQNNENLNKTRKNMFNRFIRGVGAVSDSFFNAIPNWTFTKWSTPDTLSNKESLNYLISLSLAHFDNVYIRDNSYFGVPCYFIYIPGVSSYPRGMGFADFSKEEACNMLHLLSEYAETLTTESRNFLLSYYANNPHKHIQYDCLNGLLYKEIPEELVIAALFADNQQYQDAAEILKALPYYEVAYKAIREEFTLCQNKIPEVDRDRRISLFYGNKNLELVKKICRNSNITKALLENRNPIPYNEKRHSAIFQKLKDSQFKIDQLQLLEYLS